MKQSILHIALVVRDYDEAIDFYCNKLHFTLVEDTYQPEQDKRWVLVAPPGSTGANLLLARASTSEQEACIGRQTGGRVFFFCTQTIFGAITRICWQPASTLCAPQKPPLTERWRSLKIYTAICGI